MRLRTLVGRSSLLLAAASIALYAHDAGAQQTLRVQVDQSGDFVMIGNTLGYDCDAGTPAPVVGTVSCMGSANNGDSSPDLFWRSDDPAAGQASANDGITVAQSRSTAVLSLPPTATVTHAFLYWGGERTGGADTSVTLERPGGFSANVTATQSFTATAQNEQHFESVADVTSIVQANGNGAYRLSGLEVNNWVDIQDDVQYSAWSLVVLYSDPTEPPRNLAVFDGLNVVSDGNPASVNISGFLVPNAGFDAKLGVITYEGDGDSGGTGDSLFFGEAPFVLADRLSDTNNPANNFFNSTRSFLGAPVSVAGDLPQLTGGPRSMGSFDLDVVDITDRVTAGQTDADIQATSTGDVYLLGAFVTSISTFKPDFTTSAKSVVDVNGGALVAGDTLEYTITVTNSGNDASINTVLTDDLPAEVTYVPGTLQIVSGPNAGAKTDLPVDDQGDFNALNGVVTFRLGAGANGLTGGTLEIGETTVVRFRVQVNAGVSGTISNQGIIDFEGEQGAPPDSTPTDGDNGNPGQDPTDVTIDECATNAECTNPDEPVCDTASDPNVCVQCLTDGDCTAPTGVCDTTTNTCVECIDDSDCPFPNYECDSGAGTCECTPSGAEVCGNDADEDCDGTLDNGCVDTDGDGIPDDVETNTGTDPNDADSDDDGIIDGEEPSWNVDSDGDGLINALDPDSDNDALFDGTEVGNNCNNAATDPTAGNCIPDGDSGATTTNPLDADTDDGSVSDGDEDSNLDGVVDPGETDPNDGTDDVPTDTDGDGIDDDTETTIGTDPNDADSDDDGLIDGQEPNPSTDTDGDGLINGLDPDSDNDGLFDGTEAGMDCSNPDTDAAAGTCTPDADAGATTTFVLIGDSDGGGAIDGSEDCNLNGAIDPGETDPNEPADDTTIIDTDGDGLSDCLEIDIGTDPNDQDSDDDGLVDGEEPNPNEDFDGDGSINALDPDSDNDDLFDGTETGHDCSNPDTEGGVNCIPDGDGGATTTNPLDADTDDGSVEDGTEDADHDGVVDPGETDPNDGSDDVGGEGGGGAGEGGDGQGGGAHGGGAHGGGATGGSGNVGGGATGGNGGQGGDSGVVILPEGGGLIRCATTDTGSSNSNGAAATIAALIGLAMMRRRRK